MGVFPSSSCTVDRALMMERLDKAQLRLQWPPLGIEHSISSFLILIPRSRHP